MCIHCVENVDMSIEVISVLISCPIFKISSLNPNTHFAAGSKVSFMEDKVASTS